MKTVFGALGDYQKGGVEVIKGDPKNYVFSIPFDGIKPLPAPKPVSRIRSLPRALLSPL